MDQETLMRITTLAEGLPETKGRAVFFARGILQYLKINWEEGEEDCTPDAEPRSALQEISGDFIFYPNPSTRNTSIIFEQALTGELRIINSSGQEVISRELNNQNVLENINLDSGLYYILFVLQEINLKSKNC